MIDLSPAEKKVLFWVRQGLTSKAVGEKLNISFKTVKFHLTAIFRKTGLKSSKLLISTFGPPESINAPLPDIPEVQIEVPKKASDGIELVPGEQNIVLGKVC